VDDVIVRFIQTGVKPDGFVKFDYNIRNLELVDHQGQTVFQSSGFDKLNQTAVIDYKVVETVHIQGVTQDRGSDERDVLGIDLGFRARQLQRRLTIEFESREQTEFDCTFDLPPTQAAVFQDPSQTCMVDQTATEVA
jgi:hypothetical protein